MKKIISIGVLSLVVLLGGCANQSMTMEQEQADATATATPPGETPPSYETATPKEVKEKMDNQDEMILVDVRTQEEYDQGHIPNAILIPNETIGETMPEALPNLEDNIYVYCRSGNRSQQAAEKLAALGYQNVYDFGGIKNWEYDIVTTKTQ